VHARPAPAGSAQVIAPMQMPMQGQVGVLAQAPGVVTQCKEVGRVWNVTQARLASLHWSHEPTSEQYWAGAQPPLGQPFTISGASPFVQLGVGCVQVLPAEGLQDRLNVQRPAVQATSFSPIPREVQVSTVHARSQEAMVPLTGTGLQLQQSEKIMQSWAVVHSG
jgi:hypothetical protein